MDERRLREELDRRWPDASVHRQRVKEVAHEEGPHHLDLYLAKAAADGERWALTSLERDVFTVVQRRLAKRFDPTRADEALQQVREQLLVGVPGVRAFTGRGPLVGWVTIIAARRLMTIETPDEVLADEFAVLVVDDVDAAMLRARFSSAFKGALERALASLERRQRLVLRMHTIDGLSAQKIGAIFHVHRATASQWLLEARTALRERTTSLLRDETGASLSELESIAKVLQRVTDLSLPRLLDDGQQP